MPTSVVPVLGISQRTGTHWLAGLLTCHQDCRAALTEPGRDGSSWEDLLLVGAGSLVAYAEATAARWAETRDPAELAPRLLRHLGDGLREFVVAADPPEPDPSPSHVITKSPTVDGLQHLGRLWPGLPVVVLVRDARAVVASAQRSFGGSAERWARVWRHGARTALAARADDRDGQILLVRYEDLVEDLTATMDRICDHVGLDPARFDEAAARRLPVRGSSDSAGEGQSVHWRPLRPAAGFAPLERADRLPVAAQDRVRWLVGRELAALGYSVDPVTTGHLAQRRRDATWAVARWARQALPGRP